MSRRKSADRRTVLPDPKFGSQLLTRFINIMMLDGKKAVAERMVYRALDRIDERVAEGGPLDVLESALENIRPMVEVKSRRVGGATYQVPTEVRPIRRDSLAMRWLIDAARKRGEKGFEARLANEILDASESKGAAVKKREDTHRMAEANRAFSHFRW